MIFAATFFTADTINRNMRCIEIQIQCLPGPVWLPINRNMRCIEIELVIHGTSQVNLINRNMRCIEMIIRCNASAVRAR